MKTIKVLLFMCAGLPLLAATDSDIADAIYRLEGGPKARAPYGILSLKVSSPAQARRICMNTIRNSRTRWLAAGRPGDELDYLADRYCPPSADKVGNARWKRNIHKLVKP